MRFLNILSDGERKGKKKKKGGKEFLAHLEHE